MSVLSFAKDEGAAENITAQSKLRVAGDKWLSGQLMPICGDLGVL